MSWWLSNGTLLSKSTQCLGPLSIWQCFLSTGECWRCRAIYDSRASWSRSRLDEWGKIASRSCLPPPSLHSKLTFQVKSKGAKLLPRLLFDQWAQSRSVFTINNHFEYWHSTLFICVQLSTSISMLHEIGGPANTLLSFLAKKKNRGSSRNFS